MRVIDVRRLEGVNPWSTSRTLQASVAGAPDGDPITGWNLATPVTAAISVAGALLVLGARPPAGRRSATGRRRRIRREASLPAG